MNLLKNQQTAETVDAIYIELEDRLMRNIAKHLRDWKQPIDSDVWLMKKLAEIGKLNKENIRIIAQMSGLSVSAAERMLDQVAEEAIGDLEPGFQKLVKRGLANNAVAVSKSKNMRQVMHGMKSQAKDKLNLTNTTMLNKAQEAFKYLATTIAQESLDIMNKNAASVITGAESRQQALEKAIKQFVKKGVTGFVDRRGREWTPEAYINMVMRTTAGNVAHEVQTARQRDYGIRLIEISSHAGARPKCAVDQGKIYDLDNGRGFTTDARGREVEYFPWNSTSYGEPDGILGINCTHNKFPFVAGVSIRRYFPTENMEENKRLYQQTQVQRAMERDIRKQKRECMLYRELGDDDAFEKAAVKLKSKETSLEDYVEKHEFLHRRRDREKVVGFDRSVSAKVVSSKKRIEKQADSMYDTGSEAGNIKAYYRDKPLREKIQSADTKKKLDPGQFKKHVPGTHEYEQYQEKQARQGMYGPSYLTIDEDETQELVNKYAGTGILRRDKDGRWLNEEIITTHPDIIGVVVDNRSGKSAETSVFKIKYSPKNNKGTHVIPDYPSKKGAKGR